MGLDAGSKSALEAQKEIAEIEHRNKVLSLLSLINSNLDLLNARIEEGISTEIEKADL